RRARRSHVLRERATDNRPVLTAKYAAPAARPAATVTSSEKSPPRPTVKTDAATSDESVSVPTLKSTLWIGPRSALHWTAQIATATASALRGPKRAAPASAPTALTEIEP